MIIINQLLGRRTKPVAVADYLFAEGRDAWRSDADKLSAACGQAASLVDRDAVLPESNLRRAVKMLNRGKSPQFVASYLHALATQKR